MQRVVLVTGASSGIGRHIARELVKAGYRVYGTSRKPQADQVDGYTMVPLDVTSDDSVATCVADVTQRAGQIDVLVNNAGIELLGALEETSIEEAKALFETNFFGVMRMTNAVLPAMRERRDGLIINIGSLAGYVSSPFHGVYAASKHALEGYSEALWMETEPFHVHVALIEPSFFKSALVQHKSHPARSIADYEATKQIVIKAWDDAVENGPDPAPIAKTVLKVIQGEAKGFRHRVGKNTFLARFKMIAPEWLVRKQVRHNFNLD